MSMYSESLRAFLKPIVAFLDDAEVTEIMINGPTDVWVERGGKVFKTEAAFTDEGLTAAARNMAQFVGRPLTDERPRLDARLPDGSRIHVVLPPVARRGTTIAIRKFQTDKLNMDRLVEVGAASKPMARLIEACVRLKLNVVVAGGTGSGKTTLLNVLSRFIPADERILTIEDSAELQLQQPHIVSFESRPADKFGKGEVSLGDLLNSALRLRPDRIVVGEVRGGECFFLLQAMNTGHGGSLATTHANTPTDTLRRLESLCLLSGVELPVVAIRSQVASAIGLVVCCERFPDGSRKLTHVSEVLPLNDRGDYRTQDLFVFTPTGKDPQTGKILGYHAPTGILPTFLGRLRAYGYPDLDETFFDPATWKLPPPPVFVADSTVRVRWAPSLRQRDAGGPVENASPEEMHAATLAIREAEQAARAAVAPPPEITAPPEVDEEAAEVAEPADRTDPKLDAAEAVADESETTNADKPTESEVPKLVTPPSAPVKQHTLPPTPKPKVVDEPSIQIAEDLLEEVGRAVKHEATYVRKNPLLDEKPPEPRKPVSKPPPAAKQQVRIGAPAAAPAKPRNEEDKTDPHIRVPPKT